MVAAVVVVGVVVFSCLRLYFVGGGSPCSCNTPLTNKKYHSLNFNFIVPESQRVNQNDPLNCQKCEDTHPLEVQHTKIIMIQQPFDFL